MCSADTNAPSRLIPTPSARPNLAGFLLVMLLTGCGIIGASITGSGKLATQSYEFKDFTKVNAGSAFEVTLTQGAVHQVTVTVDDNVVQYLKITQDGDVLKLGLQPNLSLRDVTLKASVTLPKLTGIDLSGAVKAEVSGFSSSNPLHVELSGASSLRGSIENGEATLDLSGATSAKLKGRATQLKVSASGASKALLSDYPSTDTTAHASGASEIEVTVSGNLEAEASGASSVRYRGDVKSVRERASGASSIQKR